ncbi:filamentation [Pyrenophora seminiperda CCB06]|uniref:Filamentation n=1 Tax=Pyrenophora seminiperda CCB06 TaxID=1302712 RepID=A0A3M7M8T7_9PLEO|nr:filamentation [Pyrenophora seminiperda CCB06]
MVNTGESDKAKRYIQQLDEARCAGRWTDVPELCRKVEKHAPHRQCLTLTARSEAQVEAYSSQRPSTASSAASTGALAQIIPPLLAAMDEGDTPAQDAFQASVCLGWVHYLRGFLATLGQSRRSWRASGGALSGWSRVCLVKGTYLKGIVVPTLRLRPLPPPQLQWADVHAASSLEKTGAVAEAVAAYSSIVPWLTTATTPTAESMQFKLWGEHSLVRLCQLSDQSTPTGENINASDALRTYRYWAKFWDATSKTGAVDTGNAPRHRRLAWKAYYDSLSTILRYDLAYEPDATPIVQENPKPNAQSDTRLRQRAELKRVETVYESLLVKETDFPKASETNHEVEAWVDAVMDNWRLLCGPTWSDDDLGEGGKQGVARSVLDILYRAATKTYHSTQILRHLFVVHASLAEPELAFKAYDSYVEIITRNKDRSEKSGEIEVGIDDDSTALRTSAEAIRMLCRWGSRKEAEKALEISHTIEHWVHQMEHLPSASEAASGAPAVTLVEPTALAAAFCAIGIGQAHWARLTYDVETRAPIQTKAIQYLRKSLSPSFGDEHNVEALYALALVLAETRDIPGAIKTAKRALSPATRGTTVSADGVLSGGIITEYGRERKLIPVWHLLALLLTSRSDFTAAEKACEAAFEQFGNPVILFGRGDSGAYRSEHLNAATSQEALGLGVVDRMERFEKSNVLQIKMTQLALLEVTDGVIAAVDGCDELLALYGRLFGDPATETVKPTPAPAALAPPKSAMGTTRGSIFRGRGSIRTAQQDNKARNESVISSGTAITQPEIQVTNDEGADANGHHRHKLFHHHNHDDGHAGVKRSPSKLRKRSVSLQGIAITEAGQTPDVPALPETVTNGTRTRSSTVNSRTGRGISTPRSTRKSVESGDRPLQPIAHNLDHSSPPLGHSEQPPKQDTRLPSHIPHADHIPPDPHFSKTQERRQKVSLLVNIWIFISGLYARAHMYQDAREAVTEALKLVHTFETEVCLGSSTAKALADEGWGGGKSVEELWADVFAARGELLVAQSLAHEGRADFERALQHFPDHPEAIVGLSNILLDIYTEAIPLEPISTTDALSPTPLQSMSTVQASASTSKIHNLTSHTPSVHNQLSPPELNRLAARDRAFGLLSTLTKLGAGWDYSEAWYALARAYEESGQVDKIRDVLWWCVELEDTHPVREWKAVTTGGFVL